MLGFGLWIVSWQFVLLLGIRVLGICLLSVLMFGCFAGYSGSDMANLCREAALGPIRSIVDIQCIDADQVCVYVAYTAMWTTFLSGQNLLMCFTLVQISRGKGVERSGLKWAFFAKKREGDLLTPPDPSS